MEETKFEKELEEPAEPESHSSNNYLAVFLALAALTAVEIGITLLPVPRAPILIPLAILKATLVALFYMHLRSDRKLFSALFVLGIVVGVSLLVTFSVLLSLPNNGLAR